MRKYRRVDKNQTAIVKQLRQAGFYVVITSDLDCGFDLLVARNGVSVTVEIKDSSRKWTLTNGEKKWYDIFPGHKLIAERTEDIVEYVNRIIRRDK